jgi:hypothetical protein
VKDIGKPCKREAYARIDGGRLETERRSRSPRWHRPAGNHGNTGLRTYRRSTPPRQSPTLLRHGNSARKFSSVDSYVHERLAILASKKHGLPRRNWQRRFTTAWLKSLQVYRLTGTVRYGTAHAWR